MQGMKEKEAVFISEASQRDSNIRETENEWLKDSLNVDS